MRDCPGMGKLREDCTALGMHRRGDCAPALDLAFGKEAGGVDESDRMRADPSAFCEDEAGRRSLAIIFDMKLAGREFRVARAAPRHGGHHHAVSELKFAEHVGSEERCSVRLGHDWGSGKMPLGGPRCAPHPSRYSGARARTRPPNRFHESSSNCMRFISLIVVKSRGLVLTSIPGRSRSNETCSKFSACFITLSRVRLSPHRRSTNSTACAVV